jgi:protein O-GlcNAc transferase
MKKFLTVLNLALFLTLVILTLYVFGIIDIPFLSKNNETKSNQPTVVSEETDNKVERKKGYDELIKKGDLYYEKGFYNLAVDSYTQASNLEPTKIEPLIRIGELQLIMGNFEQAKNMGNEILKKNPQTVRGKLIIGKADIGLENFAEAKTVIDGITTDDPEVTYYQGMMALFTGEYERARGPLEQAINNTTNKTISANAQSFINALNEFDSYSAGQHIHLKVLIARSFVQVDQPKLAKTLLWNVLSENREYRDAWIILGYSYLKLKQYKEAVDALIEAKNKDPEKPETLFFLGLAYAGYDKTDEAIKELELALNNGFEPKIYAEQKLAELYFLKEDFTKANEKYEDVISMNASDIDYFVRPIWVYIDKLNQPEKALTLAEKAMINHPDDPKSFNLLGWAQVAGNDFINGRKNLEKALAMNEKFDAPYLNLGWMYEKQNNLTKAKSLYKQAYEIAGVGSPIGDLAAQRYNSVLEKEKNNLFMVNIFN